MAWAGRSRELDELVAFLGAQRTREVRFAQVTGDPWLGKTALVDRARRAVPELEFAADLRAGLAGAPVVLLDDLHLAGPDTFALLGRLIRCPDRLRLTVLLCYRPRQLAPEVQALLDEVDGLRVELGPLAPAECAELLGEASPARVAELHAASGGNPCYLKALADGPSAGARAALLSEVDGLGETGALVVRAAAVVGEAITADLVTPASDCPPARVRQALDAAVAADLLRENGAVLEFRHPVVRRMVYGSASHSWRIEAHRRVAEVLRAQRASAPERARQLEFAARPGDRSAAEVLVRAAREVRGKEPDLAARWLAAAQRLCPAPDVRLELSDVLIAAGRTDEGMALFQEAVGTAGPIAARAVLRYAAVERMFGRNLTARAVLRRALACWPDGDPVELAAMRAELACALHNTGDRMAAVRLAAQVAGTPLPKDAALIHAVCHALLAYDHWIEGGHTAAQRAADRVVALLEEATTAELAEWLTIAEQCIGVPLHLGRYAEAQRQGQRMRAVARDTGQRLVLLRSQLRVAYTQVITGAWAAADASLDEAEEQAAHIGRPPVLAYAMMLRGYLAGERGEPAAALDFAERSIDLAPASDHPWWAQVRWQLCEARRALDLPVPPDFLDEVRDHLLSPHLERLTESALRRGEPAEAADWARRCRAAALDPGALAYALLADARLLLAGGEWAGAVRLAREAAHGFARTPLRPGLARARLVAGAALAGLGERAAALGELERASALFAEFGANRLQEQVMRVQRGLGRRVSRAAGRVAPGELTAREHQVAGLISQGLPNKAIAERLVLSERTVTTHVSNILAKTGQPSRTALAAHLLRG
ncbi:MULTISPECIES: LuxR family transcriptional regulator [unclassified Crossiella]|uniref:LuxR family transcriptional regulator n=1 Tax=unclassified Crossiella TaxID=2620835 RepID=UPI001FFFE064|nr:MULTISPECIES: LuxR family transcriptional regulator [unclassified Crossiella]MCK2237390.1 LuxR C-terminal-related transcriptional regulator [Crossiella sp. S99.2]MCK2251045.1 LuxR C-terminal-related transcriptional regulator [Crossiella sp. S99.1]